MFCRCRLSGTEPCRSRSYQNGKARIQTSCIWHYVNYSSPTLSTAHTAERGCRKLQSCWLCQSSSLTLRWASGGWHLPCIRPRTSSCIPTRGRQPCFLSHRKIQQKGMSQVPLPPSPQVPWEGERNSSSWHPEAGPTSLAGLAVARSSWPGLRLLLLNVTQLTGRQCQAGPLWPQWSGQELLFFLPQAFSSPSPILPKCLKPKALELSWTPISFSHTLYQIHQRFLLALSLNIFFFCGCCF